MQVVLFSKPDSIFHKSISNDCEIFELIEFEWKCEPEYELECECEFEGECEGVRLLAVSELVELIEAIEQ